MKQITLEELLEAGCHFGHQVNRRNPKADEFIYEARSNINIINLEKTYAGLIKAAEYLKDLASHDGYVVVIGTKRQASSLVKEEVERARQEGAKGIFYVNSRWVGGTITNYEEVAKNFKKLKDLRNFLASENHTGYTKKEVLLFEREKEKLEEFYNGIVDLDRIPDALFVIDTHHEDTAVKEAIRTGVKVVGIVDTNSDPTIINYPIPANDDAIGSLKLIVGYIVDAWTEGSKNPKKEENKETITEKSETKKEEKSVEKAPAKETKKAVSIKKTEGKLQTKEAKKSDKSAKKKE